jgi:hypothetical protein
MVIFGSIADFSIDLLRDVATVAASAGFEESVIWRGWEAFFDDFLLVVASVERASSLARTMPFLFRLAGGDPGGFCSGIGEAKLSDFKP